MTSTRKQAVLAALVTTALGLTACSSSGNLTTSALLGGSTTSKPAEPKPETAQDRVMQVATTSARATRCGYVFDPAAVRSQYLAFEAAQGVPPETLAKIEKAYDLTLASVGKTVEAAPDYCTDAMTAYIKRDLGKVLAGDFSSEAKRPVVATSWFGTAAPPEKFDRDKVFERVRK